MTTRIEQETVRCGVCEAETVFDVVTHASETGVPDLDTRPPEPMRGTIARWVQQCPSCGYCAPAIARAPSKAERVVKTAGYRAVLENETLSPLARRFQCASAVFEIAGTPVDAAWQSVYAAWVCDDAGDREGAVHSRERAIELFDRAIAAGLTISDEGWDDAAVTVDLLRRAHRYDDAIERAENAQ
ncbi:MAG: hypothetical protein WCJ30_19695 [Deltaproteobacteria bacterium]